MQERATSDPTSPFLASDALVVGTLATRVPFSSLAAEPVMFWKHVEFGVVVEFGIVEFGIVEFAVLVIEVVEEGLVRQVVNWIVGSEQI